MIIFLYFFVEPTTSTPSSLTLATQPLSPEMPTQLRAYYLSPLPKIIDPIKLLRWKLDLAKVRGKLKFFHDQVSTEAVLSGQ